MLGKKMESIKSEKIATIKNSVLGKFDSRSANLFKNISITFVVKSGSVFISMLLIPITLSYVSSTEYGIWITISSIISWMTFFDIGMSNGLRNKLTYSLAQNDFSKAKAYVSTTYVILALISSFILILSLNINQFLDWNNIYNGNMFLCSICCSNN